MQLDLPVTQIMSSTLTTVAPDTAISELEPLFEQNRIHHLLVQTPNKQLVGIISKEDYAWQAGLSSELKVPVASDLMSPVPIQVTRDTTIDAVLAILLENRIRCLPIVNSEGGVVGVVTPYDFLKWIWRLAREEEPK